MVRYPQPIRQPCFLDRSLDSFLKQLKPKLLQHSKSHGEGTCLTDLQLHPVALFWQDKTKVSEASKPVAVNVVILQRCSGNTHEKLGIYFLVKFLASRHLPFKL